MTARKTVRKGRMPATKKNTRLRLPGRKTTTRKSTRKKSTSKRRK